jgi:hypothetical protein
MEIFFRGVVTNPELVDQVIMKLHAGTPHIQRRFRSSSLSRLVRSLFYDAFSVTRLYSVGGRISE